MANYNCRLRLFFPGPVELGGGGPSWWREKRTAHPGTAGSGLPPGLGRGLAVTHPRGPAWHRETRPCRHTKRSPGSLRCPTSLFCVCGFVRNRTVNLPSACLPAWVPIRGEPLRGNPLPGRGRCLERQRAGRQEERLSEASAW